MKTVTINGTEYRVDAELPKTVFSNFQEFGETMADIAPRGMKPAPLRDTQGGIYYGFAPNKIDAEPMSDELASNLVRGFVTRDA
jgi:hypothetical protein